MNIIEEAQKYVTALFKEHSDDKLRYHNIEHTKNVVKAARLIASKCSISEDELEMLTVSAWFHDVGYLEKIKGHEEISARLAVDFLKQHGKDEAYIAQVEKCISATKIPQTPHDRLSAILCDADLYHVSQEDFMEDTQIFWDELSAMNGEELNEVKYLERTLKFFKEHEFKTDYGKTILEPGKRANMKKVKKALKERQQEVLDDLEKKQKKITKPEAKVEKNELIDF